MNAQEKFRQRQVIREVPPEYRVYWLLRFPFSDEGREDTIGSLLKDPATRDETMRQLGYRQQTT